MALEDTREYSTELAFQQGMSEPNVVVLDPLKLRRSCIAQMLKGWLGAEGLSIRSVARFGLRSKFELNPNCRLVIINVGGKSVADAEVAHNIEATLALFPEAPLVVVSDLDDPAEVFASCRAGVSGYVPNSLDPKIALRAFTFILGGGSYFPPSALVPTVEEAEAEPVGDPEPDRVGSIQEAGNGNRSGCELTARQQEVADLVKEGLPNKLIARHLGMTEATVKVHVRQIMRKLGVKNRTQVALSIASDYHVSHV